MAQRDPFLCLGQFLLECRSVPSAAGASPALGDIGRPSVVTRCGRRWFGVDIKRK